MCQRVDFAQPRWVLTASRKHQRNGPRQRKLWDRGLIVEQTRGQGEPSIYDPNLSENVIREMDMSCVQGQGIEIRGRLSHPHIRRFYRRFDHCIGASMGQRTSYIYVEWKDEGSVHGYPITEEELRLKGADL